MTSEFHWPAAQICSLTPWPEETGIAMGDAEACLTGGTLDGTLIGSCDGITAVLGCGHGFEAALVVLPLVWMGGRMRRRRR